METQIKLETDPKLAFSSDYHTEQNCDAIDIEEHETVYMKSEPIKEERNEPFLSNKNVHETKEPTAIKDDGGSSVPFKCDLCNYACVERQVYEMHRRTHEDEKRFQCHVCNSKLTGLKTFRRHVMIHTRGKPHQCSMCDYNCIRKTQLTQHMRLHTGEKGLPRTMDASEEINSVQYILDNYPLPLNEKVLIKNKGKPTPDLKINDVATYKTRTYTRAFNNNVYTKYEWICGCPVVNKLFCFTCLLCRREMTPWTLNGIDDLKHLAGRAKRHEESINHINACLDFSVIGKADIREHFNSDYLQSKLKHNENVDKNRHILRRLIMCVKFCGAFELASRGVYAGLINFAAELDSAFAIHMKEATAFQGASESIHHELLASMFQVYRNELIDQIKCATFVAVEADETTDSSDQRRMVIVVRYVRNENIRECFWSFAKPEGRTAEQLAEVLMAELQHVLTVPEDNSKLIAQSYDGASVMSADGKHNRVQAIIRETFPHAYFVHSYAHAQQFDLLMEQATLCNRRLRVFFANLQSFASFFSRSPERAAVLDAVVRGRSPRAAPARWDFKGRTANTLHEYRDSVQLCLETILDADSSCNTINEAGALINRLKSTDFRYWLKLFHFIMPHVEVFSNEIQTRGMDSSQLKKALDHFEQQIVRIRSVTSNMDDDREEPASKIQRTCSGAGCERGVIAEEVCDTILAHIKDRFEFKGHLSAAKLFDFKNFKTYRKNFPEQYFDDTVASYPMLNGAKLRTELATMYTREDVCAVEGALPLLVFIAENNLKRVLSETFNLLDIICTTPMYTVERERCFSTMKRAKTFLQNTVTEDEDRLNALAALSVEKNFIQSIPDFDNKVVEAFCNMKNRRMDFLYK